MNVYKDFFNTHPVFTIDEYLSAVNKNRTTAYNNLKMNYMASGKVKSIRRGLYAVVPPGSNPEKYKPDEILIASRLSDDAVLAFHTALDVMGYSHSVLYRYYFYTKKRKRSTKLNNREYISVQYPKRRNKILPDIGVTQKSYHGLNVRLTDRERTFIDCINRPEYCGGIEETCRSLEKYPYLDFDKLFSYMKVLGSRVSYARVGYFLDQNREKFFVEEEILKKMEEKIPASVVYFDPKRKQGNLIKRWNLIVPEDVIEKKWEEFQE
ncbi:MAG: type IV toxin-antitoxin system AbiEi family antitoxin domain-containing protein [Elusimicrobiota bacterium]